MVIAIVILIIFAFVYVGLPLWVKLIILALNGIIPDPIPIIDEVLMIVAVINDIIRLGKIMAIAAWFQEHKKISIAILVGSVLLIWGLVGLLV